MGCCSSKKRAGGEEEALIACLIPMWACRECDAIFRTDNEVLKHRGYHGAPLDNILI